MKAIMCCSLSLAMLFCALTAIASAGEDLASDSSSLISMDVRDASLRDVFMKLALKTRMNVLVSPKVLGTVTFRVTDMDPKELISFLARANGLEIENHGRILLIMSELGQPTSVRMEIISLQNARAEEVAKMINTLKLDKRATVTHDTRTNRLIVVYPD